MTMGGTLLVVFLIGLFWLAVVGGVIALLIRVWKHRSPRTASGPPWPPVRPGAVFARLQDGRALPCAIHYSGQEHGSHLWTVSCGEIPLDQLQNFEFATLAPGNGLVFDSGTSLPH